jgi:hypothetical protein
MDGQRAPACAQRKPGGGTRSPDGGMAGRDGVPQQRYRALESAARRADAIDEKRLAEFLRVGGTPTHNLCKPTEAFQCKITKDGYRHLDLS